MSNTQHPPKPLMFILDGSNLLALHKQGSGKLYELKTRNELAAETISGQWRAHADKNGKIQIAPLDPNWPLITNLISYCASQGIAWFAFFDAPAFYWLKADDNYKSRTDENAYRREFARLEEQYKGNWHVARDAKADGLILHTAQTHSESHDVFVLSNDAFRKYNERAEYSVFHQQIGTGEHQQPRALIRPNVVFIDEHYRAYFAPPPGIAKFDLPLQYKLEAAPAAPAIPSAQTATVAAPPPAPVGQGRITQMLDRPSKPGQWVIKNRVLGTSLVLRWDEPDLQIDSARLSASMVGNAPFVWTLGREDLPPDAQRVLKFVEATPEQFKYISRNHLSLTLDAAGNFFATDNNSANGSFLNGDALPPNTPVLLNPQEAQFGNISLIALGDTQDPTAQNAVMIRYEFVVPEASAIAVSQGRETQVLTRPQVGSSAARPAATAPNAPAPRPPQQSANVGYTVHALYANGVQESHRVSAQVLTAGLSVGNAASDSAPATLQVRLGLGVGTCLGVSGNHLTLKLLATNGNVVEFIDHSSNGSYLIEKGINKGKTHQASAYMQLAAKAFDPNEPHVKLSSPGTDHYNRALFAVKLWITHQA